MLETVYCADPKCAAYEKHVRYTFVLVRRSRACEVCGQAMVDGARSNDDDFKNGRKRVVGKALIVGGKRQPTRFKTRKKRPATKQAGYKR